MSLTAILKIWSLLQSCSVSVVESYNILYYIIMSTFLKWLPVKFRIDFKILLIAWSSSQLYYRLPTLQVVSWDPLTYRCCSKVKIVIRVTRLLPSGPLGFWILCLRRLGSPTHCLFLNHCLKHFFFIGQPFLKPDLQFLCCRYIVFFILCLDKNYITIIIIIIIAFLLQKCKYLS